MREEITRRKTLLGLASAGIAGLAGCSSLVGETNPEGDVPVATETQTSTEMRRSTETRTPTETPEPFRSVEGSWERFCVDPGHSSYVPDGTPLREEPTTRWEFGTNAAIGTQAIVHDETVFIANTNGNVFACDAVTGEQQWRFPASGRIAGGLEYVDGTLWVTANKIYALDPESGDLRHQIPLVSKQPAPVVDGTVYAAAIQGNSGGGVTALDAESGQQEWQFAPDEFQADATVAVDDSAVYVGNFGKPEDEDLYALDRSTGKVLWTNVVKGELEIMTPISVRDGLVVTGDYRRQYRAYDAASGDERWRFAPAGEPGHVPAITESTVYFSGDTTVHAVDRETGRERWRSEVTYYPLVTVVDDVVYAAEYGGNLTAFDAESGDVLWAIQHAPKGLVSRPTVVDGTVFAANGAEKGAMLALK